MKKVIRFEIEIEKEFQLGLNGKFTITNAIFTDHDNLFDYDSICAQVREALRRLAGFNMFTINVLIRADNDYSSYGPVENSYRFTLRLGNMKKSHFNGNSYSVWLNTDMKDVYQTLKDMIGSANRKFIELVKESNNSLVTQ